MPTLARRTLTDRTSIPSLPRLTAIRYVQPLREGGSLPAVVDTDGEGLFVVKFRGAGQGAKVLVAELIVGQLARVLGLPVPDLALVDVSSHFGRSEPDPEIQELLRRSHGTNVGMRYLDGAFNFDVHAAGDLMNAEFASRLVWFDALVTNPDRTHRNPNLLLWRRHPWLIDHGAALYAHHDWRGVDDARARAPFPLIEHHVLLDLATDIEAADADLAPRLDEHVIDDVLAQLPDELLMDATAGVEFADADAARRRYADYLLTRLASPRAFVAAALEARARRRTAGPARLRARR